MLLNFLRNNMYLAGIILVASDVLVLEPLGTPKEIFRKNWWILGGILLCSSLAEVVGIDEFYLLALDILLIWTILKRCFVKSSISSVVYIFFLLLFIGLVDGISELCVQSSLIAIGKNEIYNSNNSILKLIISLITLISLFLNTKLIWRKYHRNMRRLDWAQLRLLTAVIGVDTILEFFFWTLEINSLTGNNIYVFAALNPIIAVIFYIQMSLIPPTIASKNLYEERMLLSEHLREEQNAHYEYLRQREEDTRKFRHDIKDHLAMLIFLLQKGKLVEAEVYLEQLTGKLEELGWGYHLNNPFVEAIVGRFAHEAGQKGIQLRTRGSFPSDWEISCYDLTTIFSNLLSNALEAVKLCGGNTIQFEVRHRDREIYIHLENDCLPELTVNGDSPPTGKEDKNSHGFGLENVKEAIRRNGGWITFQAKDGRFHTYIEMRQEINNETGDRR